MENYIKVYTNLRRRFDKMAKKSKINEKITNTHLFSVEGTLNVDALNEGSIIAEVEEEGEIDLVDYLKKFNGSYVKIQITDKTEETVE